MRHIFALLSFWRSECFWKLPVQIHSSGSVDNISCVMYSFTCFFWSYFWFYLLSCSWSRSNRFSTSPYMKSLSVSQIPHVSWGNADGVGESCSSWMFSSSQFLLSVISDEKQNTEKYRFIYMQLERGWHPSSIALMFLQSLKVELVHWHTAWTTFSLLLFKER